MHAEIRRLALGEVLHRTATRLPDKLGFICGNSAYTYLEFDALVSRVAAGLASHGVRESGRVAILDRNSLAFVALRFAVARLGAVLVPINFMLTVPEVAFILRHSEAMYLCIGAEFASLGGAAARDAGGGICLIGLPSRNGKAVLADLLAFEDLATCKAVLVPSSHASNSVAQIVYTSGTESLPKGVLLTHDSIVTQYLSCLIDLEIEPEDRILHALPLYHCAQLDVFLGPSIHVGGYNLITDSPNPAELLPLIERHQINSFFAPPTVWIALLRSPLFDRTDLRSLLKGYYGASIMPVEIIEQLQRRMPQLRLWNAYGQTEMGPLATVLKPEHQLTKPGSAGKPCIHVETRVIREDGVRITAGGEIGEIVHRSPHLMQGYLNDPEKTALAFDGGWFHSGDLATIDFEGFITVVDRKKDMIKSGGENVASREVEEVIYRMPAVSEVAVLGVPDPHWIEAVAAIIVRTSGATLDATEVVAHCRQTLAGFKVPKHVLFADALPKNASGKILKRDLKLRWLRERSQHAQD